MLTSGSLLPMTLHVPSRALCTIRRTVTIVLSHEGDRPITCWKSLRYTVHKVLTTWAPNPFVYTLSPLGDSSALSGNIQNLLV
jgi:hypothetical protein